MARLRTFLAVDLGAAIRARCVTLQETLSRSGTLKWVEPENLHVTLLFLGEVDDRAVAGVCRAVADCCAGVDAFPLTVEGVGCFGNPRRPRTVWVGVTQGKEELCALHDALEAPLLVLGCYRREERQYTPHVTLGRGKEGDNHGLAAALLKQADWHGGEVVVREVLVLSSELTPQGPVYTVLSRAPLGGASQRKQSEEAE
jgi:2'-5' RNA ligase